MFQGYVGVFLGMNIIWIVFHSHNLAESDSPFAFRQVYCYSHDDEIPTVNVATSSQMLATERSATWCTGGTVLGGSW